MLEILTIFAKSLPSALDQGIIYGIMAIGVFITFKILDFADLTVDGSFATGGCVFAALAALGVPLPVSLLVSFIAGCLAGLITSLLHCFLGIPGILSGILTQLMLWSINFLIIGSTYVTVNNRGSLISIDASRGVFTTIPIVLGIAAAIIGILYWFFGTKFGSSIRATGSNPDMARANGINVNTRKIFALMLSNGIVALAGAIYSQWYGQASVDMGVGCIVTALAAIIIGTTLIGKWGKNFSIQLLFTLVGAIIYYFVYQFVISFLDQPQLLKLFSAIVVAIFLGIPYIKNGKLKELIDRHRRKKEMM